MRIFKNMDSVRFSIIENDMQWEEEMRRDVQDEDKRSISSESSGEGILTLPPNLGHNQPRDEPPDIWDTFELESSLRSLPGADRIEKFIKTSDLNFVMDTRKDADTALMFAIWFGNREYVLKLLNEYGADPNYSDLKGRTALHYAGIMGDAAITRILLRNNAIAHQWDKQCTVTPLHCAASSGSKECIQLLLKNGAQLNAGIEKKSALHFAVQKNAIQCVQMLLQYGADPNTPQVYTETPLHIASALGHVECMKLLLENGADVRSQFGPKKNTALHLTAEDDFYECVKLLLDFGANINAKNVDNQTPLHVACLSQSVETLELLIKRGADVNAIYKDGRTALHASIVKESRSWECTRLLLEANVDPNRADNFGYTPLHIAALNEFSTCAFMLIQHGADVTARTNGRITALSFIVRRTPEVIPKFLNKFDTSIKVNEHEIGDVDCEIKLDFRCLVPNHERGETELLLAFIEVGQKRVLKHPLCETFLFLKWRRIRKFFLFSLFYHALYVLLFTSYVLQVYVNHCKLNNISNETVTLPNLNDGKCSAPPYVDIIGYIVLLVNFSMMTKEIFQIAHGFAVYLKYWENWLQWTIIIGVFLIAYPHGKKLEDLNRIAEWQYHVAGIVVFLVWLELMMLVGRFPIFGLYVQMFTTVAVNFSKFLLAYCCLLIAFSLSFCVIFANYMAFNTVSSSILKTVVMMSGELEFENIFFDKTGNVYPVTSHLLFFAFVILATVILTNLLVGLAVSDIQGLQASAGLNRLSRQAELVARLEGMLFSKILRRAPLRLMSILLRQALLRTSRWNLQICIKPNDPREKRIPRDLMTSIYKLVAERRDRNQSMKRRRHKKNLFLFKDSIEEESEVQFRHNILKSIRNRTVSEQPHHDFYLGIPSIQARKSHEIGINNLKNQINDLNNKVDTLSHNLAVKLSEISSELRYLKTIRK